MAPLGNILNVDMHGGEISFVLAPPNPALFSLLWFAYSPKDCAGIEAFTHGDVPSSRVPHKFFLLREPRQFTSGIMDSPCAQNPGAIYRCAVGAVKGLLS